MLSTGCNTFPHGVLNQPDRLDRPQKYHYIEHAERAALYETKMLGLSMVCLWAACADCARTIVASNIHYLYRLRQLTELGMKREEWRDNLVAGDTILEEAGVRVIEVEWESTPKPILFGGETVWLR